MTEEEATKDGAAKASAAGGEKEPGTAAGREKESDLLLPRSCISLTGGGHLLLMCEVCSFAVCSSAVFKAKIEL